VPCQRDSAPISASIGPPMPKQIAGGFRAHLEDVKIGALDTAPLRAWYIEPEHGNNNAVILLHGLGDNRPGTVGYAQLLLNHGYSALMPDAHAHGNSGGDIATYGLIERDDIRRWFGWLIQRKHPRCVFGHGCGAIAASA
jgi:alpha-beta hydrolase superfamily lysophospholipase